MFTFFKQTLVKCIDESSNNQYAHLLRLPLENFEFSRFLIQFKVFCFLSRLPPLTPTRSVADGGPSVSLVLLKVTSC